MKNIKLNKIQKASLVTLFAIFFGLGILLLTMSLAYAETILPHTLINNANVGGLKTSAALNVVDRSFVNKQILKIKIKDEVIEEEAINLGVSYNIEQAVSDAFLRGKKGAWLTQVTDLIGSIFITKNFVVSADINEDSLNTFVKENIETKITEPKDAYYEYKNNALVIVPDVDGKAIDINSLKKDISELAQNNNEQLIVAQVQQVSAEITAENLALYQDQIVSLITKSVTVKADEKSLVFSDEQKATWYKLIKNGSSFQIKVDKEAVTQSVKEIAKIFDLAMVKEQINTKNELLVAGRDGKAINQAQVITELLNSLAAQTDVQITAAVNTVPKEQKIISASSDGVVPAVDTELKFVQIDLAHQKLYLFENRELVNSFTISSGKIGMATPKGVHQIYNKALRPYSKLYGLYMPYWSAITPDGLYGIHELPEWPNGYKEGESHLGIPVSHGCIRLGVGAAKYVYEWAPIGTAVVIQ